MGISLWGLLVLNITAMVVVVHHASPPTFVSTFSVDVPQIAYVMELWNSRASQLVHESCWTIKTLHELVSLLIPKNSRIKKHHRRYCTHHCSDMTIRIYFAVK
ncbi:hypothetical protein BDZ97DRAFT_727788 [Flammula alnicola]|nr:hypothetical protein BDZ97DRAFT_727788 [Flammula alnicola]